MDKISIIIPAYNVEEYIERMLKSLIEQTYKNIEIIIINDGSKDHTLDILRTLYEQDSRVCYVDLSRNFGKENAMLDANIEVKSMDDTTIFRVGKVLGEVGEKDSQVGLYTIEFQLNPYTINAGRYKTEIFFGENQRYVVCDGFEQCFEVENSLVDMGFNQSVMPGFIRPKNEFRITVECV